MAEAAVAELELAQQRARPRPFYLEVSIRLVREKPLGLLGAAIAAVFLFVAVAAPIVVPGDPNELGTLESRLRG